MHPHLASLLAVDEIVRVWWRVSLSSSLYTHLGQLAAVLLVAASLQSNLIIVAVLCFCVNQCTDIILWIQSSCVERKRGQNFSIFANHFLVSNLLSTWTVLPTRHSTGDEESLRKRMPHDTTFR